MGTGTSGSNNRSGTDATGTQRGSMSNDASSGGLAPRADRN
jgi:hypothetical protein